MEVPVREQQPDVDPRISGQELGDDGQDVQAPEENRGGQDQLAARDMKLAGGDPLRPVDLIEDASAEATYVAPASVRATLRVVRTKKAWSQDGSPAHLPCG